MPVTVAKGEGITVFTVTSNPKSFWPPLCQLLGALCYSPVCCSVSENLRRSQSTSQSALGAMQIMVGLLNIGLGAILCSSGGGSWWQMDAYLYPFWMGGLFMVFGIMCILSEKFPSPCLVVANVSANLAGVAFAIAAIVLYSINLTFIGMSWLCEDYDSYRYYETTTTPPTGARAMKQKYLEKCRDGQEIIEMLLRVINIVLIVVSVLQLCLAISSAVLGCKALRGSREETNKSIQDQEYYKPLLEEGTINPVIGLFMKGMSCNLLQCEIISYPATSGPVRMSVSITKGGTVTVLTMKANPKSTWPPLCQILGALCYSPFCCSMSKAIRRLQGSTLTALGTMQIMVGLLNIGLGVIENPSWGFHRCPYWIGGLFVTFGVMCILTEKFPSPCLVGINLLMSLGGAALAIVAIVVYAKQLAHLRNEFGWLCQQTYWYGYQSTAATPTDQAMLERCLEGRHLFFMLKGGLEIILIILAVLQLCITISTAVLGIKALKRNMAIKDPEHQLLDDSTV
ncbi:uncharacterized protein ACJ7VT_020368 [Polymixia lowei]